MDPEDANTPTTRLLTLLNVSALKSRKRPSEDSYPREKLNKRKCLGPGADGLRREPRPSELQNETVFQPSDDLDAAEQEIDEYQGDQNDPAGEARHHLSLASSPQEHNPYDQHFGPNPEILTERNRTAVDQDLWKSHREKIGTLNMVTSILSEGHVPHQKKRAKKTAVLERLFSPFDARRAKQPAGAITHFSYPSSPYSAVGHNQIQDDLLSVLSAHLDVCHASVSLEHHRCIREVITLHALDHVTKKRRHVLKNNDRISRAKLTSSDPPEDVQDQGFTRPSVLFLLPFRSSALAWLDALTTHTPSSSFQIENHSRFLGEYSLPPDAVDKLATAPLGTYPSDHVEMFKGNVDDNFRLGVKMTRKSVKLFSDFYDCDIIFASPLGLRISIEKQKNSDFLSSIEILIIDQMNALAMQNWDHIQFVLSRMNEMPRESHDVDFSRIKPWYLDGFSAYLRQSILLSPFETPETRSLYNNSLKNVAGKVRVGKSWPALQVPEGIDHTFLTFDCPNPKEEADKRFTYFIAQLLPRVLRSAVQSNNTVVFIPSSFDFIRVHNYFRKMNGISFTVLSEYSSNQDISRARQAFFSGKKAFLLISERFHFYRRYKIRGIRNILFYGPPTHPQFFSEFLTYPFLDDGVDPSDLTCRVACCQYDWFKLERILGSRGVKKVLSD